MSPHPSNFHAIYYHSMALSEEAAQKQIGQMVSFILNEAKDKASEIEARALEDFNIEKLKLVQQMKEKVRTDHHKKAKQMQSEKAVAHSTRVNKKRLKKVAARQQVLEEVRKETIKTLNKIDQNRDKYQTLLTELMVQAMVQLLEDEFVVRCRECDKTLVEQCVKPAIEKYNHVLSAVDVTRKVEIRISKSFLPPPHSKETEGKAACCGGVILTSADKKIVVDNTLDARLDLCLRECLPDIRRILFP